DDPDARAVRVRECHARRVPRCGRARVAATARAHRGRRGHRCSARRHAVTQHQRGFMQKARTVGELKASGYATRSVKDEVRSNLLRKLAAGDTLFPGVLGYEDTVVPRIVNALLARQNFILLGLRGQAKSRIVREL